MQERINNLLVEARVGDGCSESLEWLWLEPSNISFGATVQLTARRFAKAGLILLDRLGKGELASERTAFGASWKWGILQGTVISLYQDANDSESSMPMVYSKAALTAEISSYAVLCFCKGCCGG